MRNKKYPVAISLDIDTKISLERAVDKLKLNSVSELIRLLIDRFLPSMINEHDQKTIILKIPSHIHKDDEMLKEWLSKKCEKIVESLKK